MSIEAAHFIISEDATRKRKAGAQVYEGQAVKLNSDGEVEAATATAKVWGISKLDANDFRDLTFSGVEGYGSGNLTAITRGTLLLSQSIFNEVEVDSSTTTASAPTTVKVFDDTVTYAVGESLYVGVTGLITNSGAGGKQSLLGKVLRTPVQTGGFLELELDPGATAVAADLA
jgi:hypothetical protein